MNKRICLVAAVLIGLLGIGTSVSSANSLNYRSRVAKAESIHLPARRSQSNRKYYYVSAANRMRFQSQYNTDACEVASLKNVLSIHHKAEHVSLYQLLHKIGWRNHGNWNREYNANPYRFGTGATISPALEARILRNYGVSAHVHDYDRPSSIIRELRAGDQLVFEGGHDCRRFRISYPHRPTDHILDLIGIKRNRHGLFVQYADGEDRSRRRGVQWCSFRQFWLSYNRPRITGDRLVVALR